MKNERKRRTRPAAERLTPTTRILPPRKKDWRPGDVQVGLFIRDHRGTVVELTLNRASPAVSGDAYALLRKMCAPDARIDPARAPASFLAGDAAHEDRVG